MASMRPTGALRLTCKRVMLQSQRQSMIRINVFQIHQRIGNCASLRNTLSLEREPFWFPPKDNDSHYPLLVSIREIVSSGSRKRTAEAWERRQHKAATRGWPRGGGGRRSQQARPR